MKLVSYSSTLNFCLTKHIYILLNEKTKFMIFLSNMSMNFALIVGELAYTIMIHSLVLK